MGCGLHFLGEEGQVHVVASTLHSFAKKQKNRKCTYVYENILIYILSIEAKAHCITALLNHVQDRRIGFRVMAW